MPDDTFRALVQRIRDGDQQAAALVIQRFEPEVRRIIRVRLTDPRLRRVLDSADICQSVLANFFVRVGMGEFDLEAPEQLLRLLLTMARNKLRDQARRQYAERRSQGRLATNGDAAFNGVATSDQEPGQIVAARDLLAEVRRHLTDDERYLADQRALGYDWNEIAATLGVGADGLRKKLTRALDRVVLRLGLELNNHA